MTDPRRHIPRVDTVLADPRLVAAADRLGRRLVRECVTTVLDRVRRGELAVDRVAEAVVDALPVAATALRPVINATGVIVHTNLGRAPLSTAARDALLAAAGNTTVEFDATTGRRARRGTAALSALARAIPAAGGVHVVNNNAAALALIATTMAAGREIVVSRGELVEIGDGFRLPDLLTSTGARLREVGTTNRTHRTDYADAVGPNTALILKIHPSNFRQTGFVATTPVRELTGLGVPVVHDIGSGLLTPHPALPAEPDADTALRGGAALITASGDKLLGGPQAGIIAGDRDLVDRLRRHPLARALRVDKLTLAALEASLIAPPTPVGVALSVAPSVLRRRAEALAGRLAAAGVPAAAVSSTARVGGGAAPGVTLPSFAVALPAALAVPLRAGTPGVVGHLADDRLLLDLRTVPSDEDDMVLAAVTAAHRGV